MLWRDLVSVARTGLRATVDIVGSRSSEYEGIRSAKESRCGSNVADCGEAIGRLRSGGGVTVAEEPHDKPWGERMAPVQDPDGNDASSLVAAVGGAG